jgi:hypothetical protein
MSELCPQCGGESESARRPVTWRGKLIVRALLLAKAPQADPHFCASMDCKMIVFCAGCGGESHGICEDCNAVVRRELARRLIQPGIAIEHPAAKRELN